MKKAISILLSLTLVLSLALAVYASGSHYKGKDDDKCRTTTASVSPSATPSFVPATTLDGLIDQLKANYWNKSIRNIILKKLAELARKKGDKSTQVIVNGTPVKLEMAPIIRNKNVLLPVKSLMTVLGAKVTSTENLMIIIKQATSGTATAPVFGVIDVRTGKYYKNGDEIKSGIPAYRSKNKIFVDSNFLMSMYNIKVEYDQTNNAVLVTDGSAVLPTPTPTATITPTPTPTATPTATPTPTPTVAPTTNP